MQAHHGQQVHTVQVDRNKTGAWIPGPRELDATRAGSIRLNGSMRDYAGMRVLATREHALIVADNWHVILYYVDAALKFEVPA